MDANNSFYVKFIATYAPTFFVYIISVLAMVNTFDNVRVHVVKWPGVKGDEFQERFG